MQVLQKIHSVKIEKSRFKPDPGEILKLLGEQGSIIDTHTTGLVEVYIKECLQKSAPEGVFTLTGAIESRDAGKILVPGTQFHVGTIIQKMLLHSEQYAFFLATAGPGPELRARSLMNQGNYLEGYIVDLAASIIADLAADQVQDQLKEHVGALGLQITNRYSPGYCSWKVEEQQKLFSLFPHNCCNISLSSSSLMEPIKSISGIIGVGASVKYKDYSCEICSMPDCNFRKTRPQ
jgi:hypothetical protein